MKRKSIGKRGNVIRCYLYRHHFSENLNSRWLYAPPPSCEVNLNDPDQSVNDYLVINVVQKLSFVGFLNFWTRTSKMLPFPYVFFFWGGGGDKGSKKNCHQILKYRTEASFCSILKIKLALES